MFDQLMALPLFHGVGHERLTGLLEKVPFHFLKYKPGDVIFMEGEQCANLRFIVSGNATLQTRFVQGSIRISQTFSAPDIIAPDYLFGRRTTYPFSLIAGENCGIMQLSKAHIIGILQSEKICLLNMLNYLSRNVQKNSLLYGSILNAEPTQRLASFILAHTMPRTSDVALEFRMRDLCQLMNVRKATLIGAVEQLEQDGIIKADQEIIRVINLAALEKMVVLSDF